jgi:hypothetical protein
MSNLDDPIEKECKTVIMEIMMVLHRHGITEVHMGGMLRLMGVSEEVAQESDSDIIHLDEKFTRYIARQLELAEIESLTNTVH